MNISYALYELHDVIRPTLKRQGALLKVAFPCGMLGYADCHPWPERGDLPLKKQLENLVQGQLTSLTHCALEFAKLDGGARLEGKSLLTQHPLPRSHFLLTHFLDWSCKDLQEVLEKGYTHLKLKMGCQLNQEIDHLHTLFLHSPFKLRLDFNEALTPMTFRDFLQRIHRLRDHMEFIEDPFPFHVEEWATIQQEGWTLACDKQVHLACHQPESARVLIVKPALHSFEKWKKWRHQTCIVTSYLDHALGQVTAAYVALQLDPEGEKIHGLLSHHIYCPTVFSQHLNWQGPQFIIPPGQGWGFDQELQQLEWISLK